MTKPSTNTFKEGIPWFITGFLVSLWALRPIWDMDIWWHIALGRIITESGLPITDPLALGREGMEWATFQGGYEWFVAFIESQAGLTGVRWIHAVAVGTGIGLFGFSLSRTTRSKLIAFTGVLVLLFLYEDRIRVRPHVFHFAAMSWLLTCLARPDFRWTKNDLFHLIPVMFVWSTFHGPASLWGLLLIGCGAIAHPRWRQGWVCLAGGIATILVSPGVIRGLISSFSVHTRPGIQSRFVPEHGSLLQYLNAETPRGMLVVLIVSTILIGACIATFRQYKSEKKIPLGLALAAAGMGLFSILFARFSWYAMGPLLLLLPALRMVPFPGKPVLLTLGIVLFAWDSSQYVVPRYAQQPDHPFMQDIQEGHPHHFPQHAARFLSKAGITGNIYNEVGWGGYLLFSLKTGTRTLYDSRIAFVDEAAQMLIDDDAMVLQYRINRSHSNPEVRTTADSIYRDERVNLADRAANIGADLIIKRTPVFGGPGVKPPEHWSLLYRDPLAEVWARKDAQLADRLKRIENAWGASGVHRSTD